MRIIKKIKTFVKFCWIYRKLDKKSFNENRVGRFFINKEYLKSEKEIVQKVLSKVSVLDKTEYGDVIAYTATSSLFEQTGDNIRFDYYLIRPHEDDVSFVKTNSMGKVNKDLFHLKGKFLDYGKVSRCH